MVCVCCGYYLASAPGSPNIFLVTREKRGSLVRKITYVMSLHRTVYIEPWKIRYSRSKVNIVVSARVCKEWEIEPYRYQLSVVYDPLSPRRCVKRRVKPCSSLRTSSWFHGAFHSTLWRHNCVTHVILRTRLPLFSHVTLKRLGEPGAEASYYQCK